MTKFKISGQWDYIKEDDGNILGMIVDEIVDKSTVRYDDDIIEFTMELTKITRRESDENNNDLKIIRVIK